ncbi:hypothetical protein Syun_029727 [Stephania yunnanensis]|uniref:Uncharacterized protein n=1 Tax=Stephania yunnanensis TaxID=152371 RepID=A0AAP0E949_9MAGN
MDLDFDSASPPEHAWRRRLNIHANLLREFSVTFREAVKMIRLGLRLWSSVREEASHGRLNPIYWLNRPLCDEKSCPYYMRTWSCKFGVILNYSEALSGNFFVGPRKPDDHGISS